MKRLGMLAELAHGAEYRDATRYVAFGAEAFQCRGHRRGVGVVALVDQQDFLARDLDIVALATALQPAKIGEREAGAGDIAANRFDRRKHRERILRPGDAVLVKASNSVGLAKLVERVAGGFACST